MQQTTDEQVRIWAEKTRSAFAFLHEEHDLVLTEETLDVVWGSLTYEADSFGIKLRVETDALFMFVSFFVKGNNGEIQTKYLQTCLNELGLSLGSVDQIQTLRGRFDKIDELITRYSTCLQTHWPTLDANRAKLFGS